MSMTPASSSLGSPHLPPSLCRRRRRSLDRDGRRRGGARGWPSPLIESLAHRATAVHEPVDGQSAIVGQVQAVEVALLESGHVQGRLHASPCRGLRCLPRLRHSSEPARRARPSCRSTPPSRRPSPGRARPITIRSYLARSTFPPRGAAGLGDCQQSLPRIGGRSLSAAIGKSEACAVGFWGGQRPGPSRE